ncbi:META domain-containing protein [Paragemmobacter straminiformis]|uniref:META domain-containing protein n=1 Tax=Paragemmobacter straminiformis TaxID=2045119 RepID=A0A842I3Y9_9RHOB|nr:META domain-containing protein [Gemmobacter straminiformis]MBC2834359.1 META domain-containing protein [Gemmobacter straminiformis]
MRVLPALLCLLLAALPAAAGEVTREITGSLAYAPRIALPPDVEMAVELSGPSGPVASLRQMTRGAQVPLPFALEAREGEALTLRAALFLDGRPLWITGEVAVPAGDEDLDLGRIALQAHVAIGPDTRLDCGGQEVRLGITGDSAVLSAGGASIALARGAAATGTRFSDGATPETALRLQAGGIAVTLRGKTLPDCTALIPDALLPLTLRGTEPFWALTIAPDGMRLERADAAALELPLPPVETLPGGIALRGGGLEVTLSAAPCHDAMTGMPYPLTGVVTQEGKTLNGCGGDPASLLAGAWRASEIGAKPLRGGAEVTLVFAKDRFSGQACNRFGGPFSLTGEGLRLGPATATRMACPAPQMEAETATFAALAAATGFDIDADGQLVLVAADGVPLLKARK